MPIPELHELSLTELTELLVTHTIELLDLLHLKGVDGHLLQDKKREVEAIQAAIVKKRGVMPHYFS